MHIDKAIEFLRERTGYLDWGDERLAGRLECSVEVASKAKRVVKQEMQGDTIEYKSKEDFDKTASDLNIKTEYQKFLKENGIKEEEVVQVYYKEKANGVKFTVQTRQTDAEDFNPTEAFRDAISEYAPPSYASTLPSPETTNSRLAIINLFDVHLDKISSIDETDKKRTVEDNINLFRSAFNELLESIEVKNPEEIVIPLGNDFWHTNDDSNSTKKGTYLGDSVDTKSIDSFRIGLNVIREAIDKARHIAPVKLIFIRGNHDNDKVLYLLECLRVLYENQEDVEVVDSRKSRQYIRYGTWLFGWAHGDNERKPKELPSLMSTDEDSRKHWSEIKQGIFFLGDIHHERRYDYKGCTVMYLRSMSTTDTWHWTKGFTAIPKTAYAFIYDKDGKREYEFKVNV